MDFNRTPLQKDFRWSSDSWNSDFYVSFPKSPEFPLLIIAAELYQDINQHDRLVLHFKGSPSLESQAVVSGDPVEFTFKSAEIESKFTGYVHTIEQPSGGLSGNTDIICVSATYLLKNADQNIYKNKTADQVVSQIAKQFGMEAITQRHPKVRASIVQAGQSYWSLLRRLANQTGFALKAENTTIFFVSKSKITLSKKTNAPYFNYVNIEDNGVITAANRISGTILAFEPQVSDSSPESGVRVDRVITGVNYANGSIIKVTHPVPTPNTSPNVGVVIPGEGFFDGE
jgi:hypothetical protein